jgi:predicted metal-dependent hydrolase
MSWWWGKKKPRKQRRCASSVTKHFTVHRETARELTLARLHHFNQHYGLTWNRVAIRNQRHRWGSCTSLRNLNFNYKLILLPSHLQDYIIVHELCHLAELNHGERFWALVAEQIPDYQIRVMELRTIDKLGHSVVSLERVRPQFDRGRQSPCLCDSIDA